MTDKNKVIEIFQRELDSMNMGLSEPIQIPSLDSMVVKDIEIDPEGNLSGGQWHFAFWDAEGNDCT